MRPGRGSNVSPPGERARRREQRAAVGAAQRAGERALTGVDRIAGLAALGDAHARLAPPAALTLPVELPQRQRNLAITPPANDPEPAPTEHDNASLDVDSRH